MLQRGFVGAYLSLIVLLPLAAVVAEAFSGGWASSGRPSRTRTPSPRSSSRWSISLVVVAINAVVGTVIAWVLVRDDFRGKSVVNAIIDLPFALPTIVAGLTLIALYGNRGPAPFNVARHQGGRSDRAAVRDPALRGARRSARAARARPRGGGGGRLAGRHQPPGASPDHPAHPSARHPRRSGAGVCPGRRRVRLGGPHLGHHPFDTQVASVFIFSQVESGPLHRRRPRRSRWCCWPSRSWCCWRSPASRVSEAP